MNDSGADILIGIDAGTSLIKCVAFSVTGDVLAVSSNKNDYLCFGDDQVEQCMLATRENMLQTLTELISRLGTSSNNIKAVSVTGQGDGMWLLDKAGKPVQRAWLWLDSRAAAIATELENSDHYATLYDLTGTAVNASQARTQMIWLERNDPAVLDKATSCLHCKDYLYYCLTGERATDPGEALFTFGDYKKYTYSSDVLSILGLSHRTNLLPPIVDGLVQAASLSDCVSDQTGLPKGVQVNLAPVDVVCSALGGGLYERGSQTAMTLLGTTGVHMRYSGKETTIQLPEHKTGYTIAFPGGGFVQLQTNMSATMNIDWLLTLMSDAADLAGSNFNRCAALDQLDAVVDKANIATGIYQPYISTAGERGPFFDADARAGFIGVDRHTRFKELARMVYEGICFAARDCYDDLGKMPKEIRIAGGGANSKSLKQIFASIMDRPVRSIQREESGAAGAAMISAVHLGYYCSVDECVDQWVAPHLGEQILPVKDHRETYQRLFPIYKQCRKSQAATWSELASLRQSIPINSKRHETENAL